MPFDEMIKVNKMIMGLNKRPKTMIMALAQEKNGKNRSLSLLELDANEIIMLQLHNHVM